MAKQKDVLPLESVEQSKWLSGDIPYRIRAVLTGLPMQGKWRSETWPPLHGDRFRDACVHSSIWEGRHIAMRWLIEFVGIADADRKTGIPQRPKAKGEKLEQQVMINRFAGGNQNLFDEKAESATKLSLVWKACTQASSHPTIGTNHQPIPDEILVKAIAMIIAHLEQTIYDASEVNLFDAVHRV